MNFLFRYRILSLSYMYSTSPYISNSFLNFRGSYSVKFCFLKFQEVMIVHVDSLRTHCYDSVDSKIIKDVSVILSKEYFFTCNTFVYESTHRHPTFNQCLQWKGDISKQ